MSPMDHRPNHIHEPVCNAKNTAPPAGHSTARLHAREFAAHRHCHARGAGDEVYAVKLANYFVGQIVGSMNESKPADRVVLEMVDEFIDSVQRINDMMQ